MDKMTNPINCILLLTRIQNITKNGMSNNIAKNNYGIKESNNEVWTVYCNDALWWPKKESKRTEWLSITVVEILLKLWKQFYKR